MNNLISVIVFSFIVYSCSGETPFDSLVDEILLEAEQHMINTSQTTLNLPDLHIGFDKKVLFFHLKGDLETVGGSVSNMSTIKRIGDIVPVENNDLVITATFGMEDLSLHFDEIKADFLFIHIDDGFDMKVTENALMFNITFHYDQYGNCSVILNESKVTKLGGFHTTISPNSFLHDIADKVVTVILDIISGHIETAINQRLTPIMNNVIQKLDLCDKILL